MDSNKIMITGACGTIGSEIVRQLKEKTPDMICVDNDENGLFELRERFGDENITYLLADVSRENELTCHGCDIIYHCAALKHVDICETNPWMAIRTNVHGTRNIIESAIKADVGKVILISTDKAVNPIGVMGATKLLSEKLMRIRNEYTDFITVRFGNIWGSRGSLMTRIKTQIVEGNPITITDPLMQRYFFPIEDAVKFIIKAGEKGKNGETWIPKMELKPLPDIIDEIKKELGAPIDYPVKTIGIRKGEKIIEELLTEQENLRKIDRHDLYIIPPLLD